MSDGYHELANVTELNNPDALTISRARALLDAVERQRFYSLVQLLRHSAEAPALEVLIVDVECDDVPKNNPTGIRYLERLALCVPSDATKLIEVLALRKDFPVLMHQNQGVRGAPASLCLYFEPPPVVTRTWTPASFLRRIQWWLEKSARGELHPADQPVEHLFFATKYECVLPWNLDELKKDPSVRFVIVRGEERPDGGFTCSLEAVGKLRPHAKTVEHIELTLSPMVHGFVERDPSTLGELADALAGRGLDLVDALTKELHAKVGAGTAASAGDNATLILLHIPIRRDAAAEPSSMTRRAFFVLSGHLKLGVALGALIEHQNQFFQDVLNTQPSTAWRDQAVLPMAVLTQNDAAAARRQSGISDGGPAALLIGGGALGSALLNLWGRIGWGRWTVVDQDHIKPHNLSRHTAYRQHVGEMKAKVVAGLHSAAMGDATQVTAVVADATKLTAQPVEGALRDATFVVDASTTLEYPRAVSCADGLPRHCSVFITPDGNAAVLLLEDAGRTLRLRTLEAQYYRALIQGDWGEVHLATHPSTFWTGTTCRDISTVMSYSRILTHAGTLAEQVQAAALREGPLIRAWQRDPLTGSVEVHDVPVAPERRIPMVELDLFIDGGVEEQLRAMRRAAFPNETGGILLGYYDFNITAVVIVTGLPAPPDSRASRDSFERGVAGLAEAVRVASVRTAGMVNYIGEWHSHPPGHSASPSAHDVVQLIHLALGMADDGLAAVQLIVGEDDLQVLRAKVN